MGSTTIYGNPIRMHTPRPVCEVMHMQPGETLGCFRHYLIARVSDYAGAVLYGQGIALVARLPNASIHAEEFRRSLLELDGKELWCPGCGVGSRTCHARILEITIEYVQTMYQQGIFQ